MKLSKPTMGMQEMENWYDFSLEDFTFNHFQHMDSVQYGLKIVEEEVKLLDGQYNKVFLGGFSGGGLMMHHITFIFMRKAIGGLFVCATFATDMEMALMDYLLRMDPSYQKYVKEELHKVPIHAWYGKEDPFFKDKPTETRPPIISEMLKIKYNVKVLPDFPHKISFEAQTFFKNLMEDIVKKNQEQAKL